MDSLFTKYAYFLDRLRLDAKIKVRDFCDGVCNERTYRRYLSGDQIMSQVKLNMFCEKLGFESAEFFKAYYSYEDNDYSKVDEFNTAINNREYDTARELLRELHNAEFVSKNTGEFFQFCVIKYNYRNNLITKMDAYDQYCKLIRYPEVLDKMYFDYVEIFTIHQIAILEHDLKKSTALDFLYKILKKDEKFIYLSSDNVDILPTLFQIVAKYNGLNGKWDILYEMSVLGIKFCLSRDLFKSIGSSYYYLAIYYNNKNDIEKRQEYCVRAISAGIASHNYFWLEDVLTSMKRDFKGEPLSYINDISIERLKEKVDY